MATKSKVPKMARLPGFAALLKRDMEEVYADCASRYVRCICGHLKNRGYVCDHCGDADERRHVLSPDPMEIGA